MTRENSPMTTQKLPDRYSTRGDLVLVLNCGSSSIKFAVFDAGQDPLPREPVWNGKVQGIGRHPTTFGETGIAPVEVELDARRPYHAALELIRQKVLARLDGRKIAAIAHRVVHGGSRYSAPTRITRQVLEDLKGFIPLAPLHQPFALEAIGELLQGRPDLPQVACFDTAFHSTLPQVEQMLAMPYACWEQGLRRYGFHGLSYDYISRALPERIGDAARGKVIVAHLGSGASLCAMQNLGSVATTMGFSALDGLMMGTRCGALDPGAVLYLMEIEKLTLEEVGQVLYHHSGLFGVSGVSADPPVLLAREDEDSIEGERIRAALHLWVRRIVREIGALTAVLGGLDVLVFTAGIGEHSDVLRERICAELEWLGLRLDHAANTAHGPIISAPESRVTVVVERTNEEWIAARQALDVVAES